MKMFWCSHRRPVVQSDDGHWFHVDHEGKVVHLSCAATIHVTDIDDTGTAIPYEFQTDRTVLLYRTEFSVDD